MLEPTNAAAKTIDKLTKENAGYEQQLITIQAWIDENNSIINELDAIATWQEVVVEEPLVVEELAPVSENPGMLN